MPEDFLPTVFFTLVGGAWVAGALRFLAFLVDGTSPKLPIADLDESALGALEERGTVGIRDSGTS
jgi:hypothetical protein